MDCHFSENSYSDTAVNFSTQQFPVTAANTTTSAYDLDFSYPNINMDTGASNQLANNGNNHYNHHYNGIFIGSSGGTGDSSGYLSSPSNSAPGSYCNHHPGTTTAHNLIIERSISSHCLNKDGSSYSMFGFPDDLDDESVRRAFSTGDLEGVNSYMMMMRRRQRAESPLSTSSENSLIIEGMSRATKYSPEEKMERIERYRTKRNQRNFNKKIQYSCRKKLADSRPRIKGRFARNDETVSSSSTSTMMLPEHNVYDHYTSNDQWIDLLDDEEEVTGWADLLDYPFPSQ